MAWSKKQIEENRKSWEERDKEKKKREKTMQLIGLCVVKKLTNKRLLKL